MHSDHNRRNISGNTPAQHDNETPEKSHAQSKHSLLQLGQKNTFGNINAFVKTHLSEEGKKNPKQNNNMHTLALTSY